MAPETKSALETRLVLRQIDAWMEDAARRDEPPRGGRPVKEMHLELTHRCNLRCEMCHHWEMPFRNPETVSREMDLGKIQNLIRSPRLDAVEMVVLTGGEPMLRRDFNEIVRCLVDRFPAADIIALANFWNTELLRRRLSELRERGIRRLFLGSSLDGVGAAHDAIRGQAGAFDGLMRSVEMLKTEFPEVHFSFNFTITPKNHRELWPAYRFVSDLGAFFSAQAVVNHQGFEAPETYRWTPDELSDVARQIDLITADIIRRERALDHLIRGEEGQFRPLWGRLLFWRYLRRYVLKPSRLFKDCMAGERFAMFDPEGNVFYCPVNKHRAIGNAAETSFDEVWSSRQAEKERRFVKSCQCDCWLNCIANPVLENLTRELLPEPAVSSSSNS